MSPASVFFCSRRSFHELRAKLRARVFDVSKQGDREWLDRTFSGDFKHSLSPCSLRKSLGPLRDSGRRPT